MKLEHYLPIMNNVPMNIPVHIFAWGNKHRNESYSSDEFQTL